MRIKSKSKNKIKIFSKRNDDTISTVKIKKKDEEVDGDQL